MMLAPLSTIGILGGGQLGRMLAMAAAARGYLVHVYCPDTNSPASHVAARTTVSTYEDQDALLAFAKACDVVTFEFENVPPEALALMGRETAFYPSVHVLRTCRHRLREKELASALDIRTAPYASVETKAEMNAALEKMGYPCVLKRCKEGYDGKGQMKIINAETAQAAFAKLGDQPCVLEGWVTFDCEISVIVARDQKGRSRCYDPTRNYHENHVLAESVIPASIGPREIEQAKHIAVILADALDLVGLLAVEFFAMPDGTLLVNELAPRPHNSGHWTMEGAETSQFEQHIRAISGSGLGETRTLSALRMVNLLGDEVRQLSSYIDNPNAHIHIYGKEEIRPGRKMGHVTMLHVDD